MLILSITNLCHLFCRVCVSRVLFCSSVLNLCELVALRPDLAALRKVIYFHENQLVYPVRKQQERDFQYGYNQILSWYVIFAFVQLVTSFTKKWSYESNCKKQLTP